MDFAYFVFFVLACVGMCHIIVDSSVMQWFRNIVHWVSHKFGWQWPVDLISCYQCTGFWCGVLLGALMLPAGSLLAWYWQMLVGGMVSSYMSMIGAATLNYLDRPWEQK